jgi:CO/xanthine dehydrogenase Mo-binding subunit
MANANIEHALVASNESDDVAPLFRTPTPPRPHTSTLLMKCGKGALLVTALLALAALASHAANGPSHAAPFMATKTTGLVIATPAAFGVALSAKTAGQPWATVNTIYAQVQNGGSTDPAIAELSAYYAANPTMQSIITGAMSASQLAASQPTTPANTSNATNSSR